MTEVNLANPQLQAVTHEIHDYANKVTGITACQTQAILLGAEAIVIAIDQLITALRVTKL